MNILDGERLLLNWGLERFKAGSTFGALSDAAIGFLLRSGRIFSLDDGELLFHGGDDSDCFYIVLEGQLDTSRKVAGGIVAIRTIRAGEQIGYVSMIGLFERLGDGCANGTTIVLEISSGLFYQLHEDYPFDFGILMLNLSREMARSTRFLIGKLTVAGSGRPISW